MDNQQPSAIEPLLTLDEVSAYIGIPKNTLYRWRVDGKGPRAIKYGKHLRYRRAEVESWLDAHTDVRPAA
jgi:excisionase family DNA binding protein